MLLVLWVSDMHKYSCNSLDSEVQINMSINYFFVALFVLWQSDIYRFLVCFDFLLLYVWFSNPPRVKKVSLTSVSVPQQSKIITTNNIGHVFLYFETLVTLVKTS